MIAYILSKFPDRRPNASNKIHCKCPFHDDKNPSFSIDLNKGLFICGSARCGVRGNFFLFYKLMEGLTWGEVYDRLGRKVPKGQEDLGKIPFASLNKKGVNADLTVNEFPMVPFVEPIENLEYLNSRELGKEVTETFGMMYGKSGEFDGVDISNSIVSPVLDLDGSYVTFQVRYLDNRKMRWKNPRNSRIQNMLYGGWLAGDPGELLWVVEGASDVWNLHRHGMKSVGLFTKEASSGQLNRIFNLCNDFDMIPISFLDGDANKNNHILADEMSALGLKVGMYDLPYELDPGCLGLDEMNQIRSQVEESINV